MRMGMSGTETRLSFDDVHLSITFTRHRMIQRAFMTSPLPMEHLLFGCDAFEHSPAQTSCSHK